MNIQVLPPSVADQIAAGEVVERPASVIKELVENSIDAGAKNIAVEIKNGGVTFIRVTDDGTGMTPEDAKVAFLRHATSKIQSIDDLDTLSTFGFRGEALAAISSVSKIELITCTDMAETAFYLTMDGGKITQEDEIGAPRGTTIIVRDLFYNTPARMKFLKKDSTEAAAVITMMQRIAIGRHNVSFTVISDSKVIFRTGASSEMKNAIHAIYGDEITKYLIPIKFGYKDVDVKGFICPPHVSRSNRNMQFTYVNDRFVKSKTIYRGIDDALQSSRETGKYSVCFIKISTPPDFVDVNVHPSKIEVKFIDEGKVIVAIKYAIVDSRAFDFPYLVDKQHNSFVTYAQMEDPQNERDYGPKIFKLPPKTPSIYTPFAKQETFVPDDNKEDQKTFDARYTSDVSLARIAEIQSLHLASKYPNPDTIEQQENLMKLPFSPGIGFSLPKGMRLVGEIFTVYLLVEFKDVLYIIDKHAVHEKLIYNKLQVQFKQERKLPAQRLLSPIPVAMTAEDIEDALININLFRDAGFDFFESGISQISITSIPGVVSQDDVIDLFTDFLRMIQSKKSDLVTDRQEKMMKMIACRCAIKGGKACRTEEVLPLLQEWVEGTDVSYCPHGRPVVQTISKKDFDKMFKRIK